MKVRRNLLIALSLLSLGANAQRIKGSDTVLPVAQQTAERFIEPASGCPCHCNRWRNRCGYLRFNG